MIQVIDDSGREIRGLYRLENGALIVKNDAALRQSVAQYSTIEGLNKEINLLKEQIKTIMEHLNG